MTTADMVVPEGFKLGTSGGTLTIAWRGPSHWICLVGGGFALALTGALLVTFALASPGATGAMVIFAAGTLLSAYLLLIGVCNRTVVKAGPDQLEVRHGPIPCPFARLFQLPCKKRLPTADIQQLRIREEVRRNTAGELYSTYGIHALTRHGDSEQLLTGLVEDEAAFLERELEGNMAARGRSASGEVRSS